MIVLLDTHVILWYQANDPKLSKEAHRTIGDSNNTCYVSIVSLWEIALKFSIGKLSLSMPLNDLFETIERAGFETLELSKAQLLRSAELPLHHRDPFDRMLIAQAKSEGMHLLTSDSQFARYDVSLLKA